MIATVPGGSRHSLTTPVREQHRAAAGPSSTARWPRSGCPAARRPGRAWRRRSGRRRAATPNCLAGHAGGDDVGVVAGGHRGEGVAVSMPASSSVSRSKPMPVTCRPWNSGPEPAEGRRVLVDDRDLWPSRSSRRARRRADASAAHDRPCARSTPRRSVAPARPRRVPARRYTRRRPPRAYRRSPSQRGAPSALRSVRGRPYDRAVPSLSDWTTPEAPRRRPPVRSDRLGRVAAAQADRPAHLRLRRAVLRRLRDRRRSSSSCPLAGLAYLRLAPWLGLAVVVVMIIVVLSYRQIVHAYPSGGGDYEVATRTSGRYAGLVGGQRAAGRLHPDRRGVGLRRRGNIIGGAVPLRRPAPGAVRGRADRAAGRGQPARHPGVGHGVRRPGLRCSSSASSTMIVTGLIRRLLLGDAVRRRERGLRDHARAEGDAAHRPGAGLLRCCARSPPGCRGADRRRGHQQRRAGVPASRSAERRDHAAADRAARRSRCSSA